MEKIAILLMAAMLDVVAVIFTLVSLAMLGYVWVAAGMFGVLIAMISFMMKELKKINE